MDMKNEQDLKLNFKMAQIAKISEQVQLKCSGHKFYDFFTNKMDSVIQMFPHIVTSYKILEGNGFAHGSVIHLKYNIGENINLPYAFSILFLVGELSNVIFSRSNNNFNPFIHILESIIYMQI